MLISLIEYIATTYSREIRQDTIIDSGAFEAHQKQLEKQIYKLVRATFTSIEKGKADSMAAKSKGFNYPAIQKKIKRFRDEFKVPLQNQEITDFKETRDSLVHSMKFRTENPLAEYLSAVHLLDRMLLCLLGYDGYYIDITSLERKPLRS